MKKKQFFPNNEEQKKRLIEKFATINPGISISLQKIYGGNAPPCWSNEAWPENSFAEIHPH